MNPVQLIVLIFFASCMSKSNEPAKPVYDETSLKAFVLGADTINERIAVNRLDSILTNASADSTIFRQTIAYLERPFSDPNSTYRNQKFSSKLLQAKGNSKWYNTEEKKLATVKIKLLAQNNVGSLSNDFSYITPAGDKKKMYDIKANYVLLYFNNPDCYACKEMKEALTASAIINQKLKTGALKILSIYTDKDENLWLDHLNEYPKQWIQGRDEDEYLHRNGVYDLRAIPTIYLLDKDKNVLLKDCVDISKIEEVLSNNP